MEFVAGLMLDQGFLTLALVAFGLDNPSLWGPVLSIGDAPLPVDASSTPPPAIGATKQASSCCLESPGAEWPQISKGPQPQVSSNRRLPDERVKIEVNESIFRACSVGSWHVMCGW